MNNQAYNRVRQRQHRRTRVLAHWLLTTVLPTPKVSGVVDSRTGRVRVSGGHEPRGHRRPRPRRLPVLFIAGEADEGGVRMPAEVIT